MKDINNKEKNEKGKMLELKKILKNNKFEIGAGVYCTFLVTLLVSCAINDHVRLSNE